MLSQVAAKYFGTRTPLHSKICVIGGGAAGLNFASQYLRQKGVKRHEIRVFEASKYHYYQSGLAMVGGGIYKAKDTVRKNENLYSKWINFSHLNVVKVDPKNSVISTENGEQFSYEHLVIASDLQNNFSQIKGAQEALQSEEQQVGSVYDYNYAQKFNELVQDFGGGRVLFTSPNTPIRTIGSATSALYLTEERLAKKGVRTTSSIELRKASHALFPQPKYASALEQLNTQKGIHVVKGSNLVEINGAKGVAVFEDLQNKHREEVKFDLAHIVPPQSAPSFVSNSGDLADETGYVDVNPLTLQHKRYPNVWVIGDSANLPTPKTPAAIMGQTPVVVENLYHVISGQGIHSLPLVYDGYSSSPMFVGGGKLILAEVKYDGALAETFSSKQEVPSSLFYKLKRNVFPWTYWNVLPLGVWHGSKGVLPVLTKAITSI